MIGPTRISPGVYRKPGGGSYAPVGGRIPRVTKPVVKKPLAPVTTPPVANPIPAVDNSNIANATPPAASAPNEAITNTLFPTEKIFEPQNYQGSPLYQFQLQEGQKQVQKSLAARGLTNSGYGITQELNVPLRAAAQDTARMTDLASQNANRLQQIQADEAGRLERAGNNQWDRGFSLASLMAAQSPWNAAFSGVNSSADATSAAGKANANFLANYYKKTSAGLRAPPSVPIPSGPNYNNINPAQISGNQSSSNGWLNIGTSLLSSFL